MTLNLDGKDLKYKYRTDKFDTSKVEFRHFSADVQLVIMQVGYAWFEQYGVSVQVFSPFDLQSSKLED